jgi:hypothetical protein
MLHSVAGLRDFTTSFRSRMRGISDLPPPSIFRKKILETILSHISTEFSDRIVQKMVSVNLRKR